MRVQIRILIFQKIRSCFSEVFKNIVLVKLQAKVFKKFEFGHIFQQ